MTTEKIITIAKEKLGKDITEQEAQDYLDGKISLPDEALDIVSGGASCTPASDQKCPRCGERLAYGDDLHRLECYTCGYKDAIAPNKLG